ncbi:MAG: hypothetical protein QGH33_05295 [Pirellulaceae bacterium]|nr:hypothetical protein [Pirellulaceae bacterium]HJN12317.1 hypothetical protein [Pirellulaceae bacterium]
MRKIESVYGFERLPIRRGLTIETSDAKRPGKRDSWGIRYVRFKT